MNALAGVDEAGLGPILGPLVVAGVAMEGPAGVDPWDALAGTVTRKAPREGQIQVADSKRVKQGPRGMPRLERCALAFWSLWRGAVPHNLAELLTDAGIELGALRRCPWYRDLEAAPLPLHGDRRELELQSHMLGRRMEAAGIRLRSIALRPVDVEEFNSLIDETDNKATTHFRAYGEVIAAMARQLPDGAHLVADRCGGRTHYGTVLRELFPGGSLRVRHESSRRGSHYDLHHAGQHLRLTFASRAEDRAFPAALASCLAKYLREALLNRINAWFTERLPGLRRTAGYYVDGQRFLAEVRPVVERDGVPLGLLLRSR